MGWNLAKSLQHHLENCFEIFICYGWYFRVFTFYTLHCIFTLHHKFTYRLGPCTHGLPHHVLSSNYHPTKISGLHQEVSVILVNQNCKHSFHHPTQWVGTFPKKVTKVGVGRFARFRWGLDYMLGVQYCRWGLTTGLPNTFLSCIFSNFCLRRLHTVVFLVCQVFNSLYTVANELIR